MNQQFGILTTNQPAEANVNLNELCRLCSSNTQEQSRLCIFDSSGMCINLKYKIATCLNIKTNEADILPKVVCFQCAHSLEKFYEFKVNCEKASQVLVNLFHAKEQRINQQNIVEAQNNLKSKIIVTSAECTVPSERDLQIKIEESEVTDPLLQDEQPNTSKVINSRGSLFNCRAVTASATKKRTHLLSRSDLFKESEKPKKIQNKQTFLEVKCDFCLKTFSGRTGILKHISKMHIDTDKHYIKCNYCNKILKNEHTLSMHIKTIHTKQFRFICDICGSGFHNTISLENHIRGMHTNERPFKCQSCDFNCASKYALKYHVKNKHDDNPRVKCDYCDRTFANKQLLKNHRIKHEIPIEERKKNHKCSICGKGFPEKPKLKHHIKTIHAGERPFECDQCDKCYYIKKSLEIHKLTHTGEREHVCETCGSAFALIRTLKDHQASVHEGLKMYKCNDCDKSYTQNKNLSIHLKKTGHTRIKKANYIEAILPKK